MLEFTYFFYIFSVLFKDISLLGVPFISLASFEYSSKVIVIYSLSLFNFFSMD